MPPSHSASPALLQVHSSGRDREDRFPGTSLKAGEKAVSSEDLTAQVERRSSESALSTHSTRVFN
jgi:hypothetical protein